MQRLTGWIVIVLVLTMAVPLGVWAQVDPQAVAQALIDNMLAGDFEAASENFDATMQDVFPPDKFEELWTTLLSQVGAFKQQHEIRLTEEQGYNVVYVTMEFEQATLDMVIPIDADGKVAGLRFANPEQATAPTVEWTPPDYANPANFTEQDITVTTGEWELPGTLAMPAGEGPFPAVVLVHGSGPNDRDESIGPNKPLKDIAWGLVSNGIAVLRYDKRTKVYGANSANPPESATVWDETINDALSAVELLRQTERIDPNRIFVLGHSMGGNLAPRIGQADPEIAGLIILAGNTGPLPDLVLYQTRYLLELDGELSAQDEEQLAQTEQLVEATRNVQPDSDPATLLFNISPAYWIDWLDYDPVTVASELTMPMLILQGERDYQVPMDEFAGWQTGLAGRENVTMTSYPGLTHLFITGEGTPTPDEYNLPGHVAPLVINDIIQWINAQG